MSISPATWPSRSLSSDVRERAPVGSGGVGVRHVQDHPRWPVIVGVGIDVVGIERFERTLQRTPSMRERLFTPLEADLPVASLAGRFAAKEALAKALGAPPGMRWTDAEIDSGRRDGFGRPHLRVWGSVAAVAAGLGITHWHVSISHDAGVATALVIAEARPL